MRKSVGRKAASRLAGIQRIGISLLTLIGALTAPGARADAVPLSVYGGLPSIEDVALSPDGSRIAYVRTQGAGGSLPSPPSRTAR